MKKRKYGELVEWLVPQIENLKNTGGTHIKGYELKSCPSLINKDIFDFWFKSLLEVVEFLKEHEFEFNLYLIASSITLKEKPVSSIYSIKKLTDLIDEIGDYRSCYFTIQLADNGVEYLKNFSYYRSPVLCDQKKYDNPDVVYLYEETLFEDNEIDTSPDTRSLTIIHNWENTL